MKLVQVSFFILMAATTIVVGEVVFQVTAALSDEFDRKIFINRSKINSIEKFAIAHPTLGRSGNPAYPDHDARGYRNPIALERASLVAIGDSFTYGTSVAAENIWTRLLSEHLGDDVYNLSFGGYGPADYEFLFSQAANLKPDTILIGIYLGNDFFDAWQTYLKEPASYSIDEDVIRLALEREQINPLAKDVIEFFNLNFEGRVENSALRNFLSRNSAFYGALRAIKHEIWPEPKGVLDKSFANAAKALTPEQLEYGSVFEGQSWRTIFTGRYRLNAEDVSDPRIVAGREITSIIVKRIIDKSRKNGFNVLFILFPTKESVFADRVLNPQEHVGFSQLKKSEAENLSYLVKQFEKLGAHFLNLTPILRRAAEQPFFENADGHPNEFGHEIIAAAIADTLLRQRFKAAN